MCIYIYIYVCMYVCMYVYIYIYIYMFLPIENGYTMNNIHLGDSGDSLCPGEARHPGDKESASVERPNFQILALRHWAELKVNSGGVRNRRCPLHARGHNVVSS